MVDIQSSTAEIRRGKKERKKERKKKKPQDENIMVFPITYGDHNNPGDRRPINTRLP